MAMFFKGGISSGCSTSCQVWGIMKVLCAFGFGGSWWILFGWVFDGVCWIGWHDWIGQECVGRGGCIFAQDRGMWYFIGWFVWVGQDSHHAVFVVWFKLLRWMTSSGQYFETVHF
jgi:hypothetical protein